MALKFDIKSPYESIGVVKATVHKSGKLGFSAGASKTLELESNRHFKVATNSADKEDKNLYLIVSDKNDDQAFKVSKAGEYYYIRVKHILDEMNVDYKNEKVIYDIKKVEEENMLYYKLERRDPINKR